MARRRSWFAWYVASPFAVVALVRIGFVLVRHMDTKQDFPVIVHQSNNPPTEHIDRSTAQRNANGALLDLAHEASAAGDVDAAKAAWDADAALMRNDARAVRDAMVKLAAADAGRASAYASSRELAERRVNDWLGAD